MGFLRCCVDAWKGGRKGVGSKGRKSFRFLHRCGNDNSSAEHDIRQLELCRVGTTHPAFSTRSFICSKISLQNVYSINPYAIRLTGYSSKKCSIRFSFLLLVVGLSESIGTYCFIVEKESQELGKTLLKMRTWLLIVVTKKSSTFKTGKFNVQSHLNVF